MVDLSISIVTHNHSDIISNTIESLLSFLPKDLSYNIYVIDNGSTDGTLDHLNRFAQKLVKIESRLGNIGFGAAHNLVLNQLDSHVHLIMNPDITMNNEQTIPILYHFLRDHQEIGMVVPKIINEQSELQYLCRRYLTVSDLLIRLLPLRMFQRREAHHKMMDYDYNQSFAVEFASGCFMAIRTSLLKELHGFDERFFLYVEDADLTRRVNQVSQTFYIPEAVVTHKWARSSYKSLRLGIIHLTSLIRYFQKWGWKFT